MEKNLENSTISQNVLLGLTTSPSSNFESSSLVSFSGLVSDFSVDSSDFSVDLSDFSVDSSDFSDLVDFSGLDFFSSSSEELSSSSESSKKMISRIVMLDSQ